MSLQKLEERGKKAGTEKVGERQGGHRETTVCEIHGCSLYINKNIKKALSHLLHPSFFTWEPPGS